MDELTLLRSTRDDSLAPGQERLARGRAALFEHMSATDTLSLRSGVRLAARRKMTWIAAAAAAASAGALLVGPVSLGVQSAHAAGVLRSAADGSAQAGLLMPADGEYLRARTHARWMGCETTDDPAVGACTPNHQVLDVYMPVDASQEWVLYRDWGEQRGAFGDASIETTRALDGRFYGSPWLRYDLDDLPTDGSAAYAWFDARYAGGSVSRDEDNFRRIAEVLASGLVPDSQRAALLEALAMVPGVTARDGVANLDGVTGVAIGRDEPLRFGERHEIIIDPTTGLVIGERLLLGTAWFGMGAFEELELTAIETSVATQAPQ